QLAVARHARRFDEQDVAAHRCPRQAGRHARHADEHGYFVLEAWRAQDGRQVGHIDGLLADRAFGDLHRHVTQHRADHALQVAYAGLARVIARDLANRVVGDRGLLRLQVVGLELPAYQVALGDLDL